MLSASTNLRVNSAKHRIVRNEAGFFVRRLADSE
jgi:hypothetical protein